MTPCYSPQHLKLIETACYSIPMSLILLLNVMVTTLPDGVQAPSVIASFLTFIIKLHTWARAFEKPATIEHS